MRIMAFDLGMKTGYAYSGGTSGVWDLSTGRHESYGMRWIKFRNKLNESLKVVDFVAYEAVASHGKGGTYAAHVYGGLVAILQEMCEERKIDYVGVPVGTIKKFATGKGNASKAMMIDKANELVGSFQVERNDPAITDDNEADAICLLEYAKANFKTGGNDE